MTAGLQADATASAAAWDIMLISSPPVTLRLLILGGETAAGSNGSLSVSAAAATDMAARRHETPNKNAASIAALPRIDRGPAHAVEGRCRSRSRAPFWRKRGPAAAVARAEIAASSSRRCTSASRRTARESPYTHNEKTRIRGSTPAPDFFEGRLS